MSTSTYDTDQVANIVKALEQLIPHAQKQEKEIQSLTDILKEKNEDILALQKKIQDQEPVSLNVGKLLESAKMLYGANSN